MRLPLIISLCWAADTTRDALIVDANHRPRRLDALDAAATSESLAGARAPPPPRGLCASSRAIELQFVHIPKAGGSTIAFLFDDALRANHDACAVKDWRPIPVHTSRESSGVGDYGDDGKRRRRATRAYPESLSSGRRRPRPRLRP